MALPGSSRVVWSVARVDVLFGAGKADDTLPIRWNRPLNTPRVNAPNRDTPLQAQRIPEAEVLAAAIRLVPQKMANREAAARRLLAAAPTHGIDTSMIWATVEPDRHPLRVRQACLAVPGSGRTLMIFVSEPAPTGDSGGSVAATAERRACIDAAVQHAGTLTDQDAKPRIAIAQALPDPRDAWAIEAFKAAGFQCVGTLSYMRCPLRQRPASPTNAEWPNGISVVRASSLGEQAQQDEVLLEALESSYVNTLDCPELCGLRETRDILASHRSTGVFDPELWYIILADGRPRGCMLLSRCPDLRSVELVYLGLAPELRGKGIAARLLAIGSARCVSPAVDELTCAVDQRNQPALALYARAGFKPFGQRVALVKPL